MKFYYFKTGQGQIYIAEDMIRTIEYNDTNKTTILVTKDNARYLLTEDWKDIETRMER